MPISSGQHPAAQRGFTYLLVLVLIALVGYGLGRAGIVWKTEAQRIREDELLFVGTQYKRAIEAYLKAQEGVARYPARLEDLLLDPRFATTKRHLRKLYPDPLAPKGEWGLILDPDTRGIAGVYSQTEGTPIKQGNFAREYDFFVDSPSYAGWRFFVPPPPPPGEAANLGVPDVPAANEPLGGLKQPEAIPIPPP